MKALTYEQVVEAFRERFKNTDVSSVAGTLAFQINIVGKYGNPVQALLKKASGLDIQMICPLHGPVLTENLEHYIGQYNTWSSYGTESEGVMIAYTSVYGNTKKAVELLAEKLLSLIHI